MTEIISRLEILEKKLDIILSRLNSIMPMNTYTTYVEQSSSSFPYPVSLKVYDNMKKLGIPDDYINFRKECDEKIQKGVEPEVNKIVRERKKQKELPKRPLPNPPAQPPKASPKKPEIEQFDYRKWYNVQTPKAKPALATTYNYRKATPQKPAIPPWANQTL